jgi:hypothetical protein
MSQLVYNLLTGKEQVFPIKNKNSKWTMPNLTENSMWNQFFEKCLNISNNESTTSTWNEIKEPLTKYLEQNSSQLEIAKMKQNILLHEFLTM